MFMGRIATPRCTVLVSVLVVLLATVPAFCQSTTAIQGTIADASGAAVSNAQVTARNTGTGEVRSTLSDDNGAYLISLLPLGTYRVEVKANGMQPMAANNVVLEIGRTTVQSFTL